MKEPFSVPRGSTSLIGDSWQGPGPTVVLLHAGVADRRSWDAVVGQISNRASVITYDRRGYGQSETGSDPFNHLDDLIALLNHLGVGEAWLVGSSAGGKLALDAALRAPERVAGLVLLAPAVSGSPAPDDDVLEPQTVWLDGQIEGRINLGDLDEANRFETWLWLDGPEGPEGRISGPSRDLALAMNRIVLQNDVRETPTYEVDAWAHLEEVSVPTTVACGSLDIDYLVERSKAVAVRIPNASYVDLVGMAHLPYLEDPAVVADIVIGALT